MGVTDRLRRLVTPFVVVSCTAYGLITGQASEEWTARNVKETWDEVDRTQIDTSKVGWGEGQKIPKAPPIPDNWFQGFFGIKGSGGGGN